MPNRLINETSPYLLQHAHNPVDWYPWGEEALEKARREDKPIFLSIGYAACHWCHVMAHESFEDEETAAIMNEHFVNIKVDREERPDLDQVYMQAVVALTGQGGWPMSVFLTPAGRPFYGGTYFPPVRRFGMPSFKEVLLGIAHAWQHERENIEQVGEQLRQHLERGLSLPTADQPLQAGVLSEAVRSLREGYDAQNGGWGDAPKFPQAMAIEFLLRQATRGHADALPMAEHALQAMARGGMYDVVGGGFHRYSVDMRWRIPHFEKMLYDNALLARAYLYAYQVTGHQAYRRVCERTLDFIIREMTHPEGGFFSSLDADSEGQEGRFYVWTLDELRAALGDQADFEFFVAAYGATADGNFEAGSNVLQRALSNEQLAARFEMPVEAVSERLQALHARLLEARSERVRPATDDKVLTGWNALALRAFAEAARYLGRPDYLQAATRNARFLLQHLHRDGHLFRAWREGRCAQPAFLEDYAALSVALLELYQSDPNPHWYTAAEALIHTLIERFAAPDGGFFDTPDDHEALLTRPRELQDNAVPSGNALAAHALLMLSAYTGRGDLYDRAVRPLRRMQLPAARYPTAFGYWLCALDFALGPVQEVVLVGEPASKETESLLETVWSAYRPRLVLAAAPGPAQTPPLLQGREQVNGRPTAYVCQNMVCRRPVTSPEALQQMLDRPPNAAA